MFDGVTVALLIVVFLLSLAWLRKQQMKSSWLDSAGLIGTIKYDVVPLQTPVSFGWKLSVLQRLLCSRVIGYALRRRLIEINGIWELRALAAQVETSVSMRYFPYKQLTEGDVKRLEGCRTATTTEEKQFSPAFLVSSSSSSSSPSADANWTIRDYANAYRTKKLLPSTALQSIFHFLKHLSKERQPFVALDTTRAMKRAKEADARYKCGKPLSILDGVPLAVKDQLDVKGMLTEYGTEHHECYSGAVEDSDTTVARLEALGMIVIGKTVMHEWGVMPFGFNVAQQCPVNPFSTDAEYFFPGGSSSGSACAVAMNICPVSLGLDGGGSVRIPASHCNLHGLSITFGHVPYEFEGAAVGTMIHVGPLANNAEDIAIVYQVLARAAEDHWITNRLGGIRNVPVPRVLRFEETKSLKGVRVGLYEEYCSDCRQDVRSRTYEAIAVLKRLGATIVNIAIPHLRYLQLAHGTIIASEFAHMHSSAYERGHPMEAGTALQLGLGEAFTAQELLSGNALRSWAAEFFEKKIWYACDICVTPTVSEPAPVLRDKYRTHGLSDTARVVATMKFVSLSNLLGFPSYSVPMGFVMAHGDSKTQLPIGFCLNAAHYEEHVLLRVAHALEQNINTTGNCPVRLSF